MLSEPISSAVERALAKWREEQFRWGRSDCILSVCDYIHDVTGADPAEPWRGTYWTEEGANRIVDQFGGVLPLFSYGMALKGYQTREPGPGAAVIAAIHGDDIAGICVGRDSVFRLERGVTRFRADIKAAWRFD